MRALSIRQPYAELILRGIKTVEYRSKRVSYDLMGERFYIYASKIPGDAEAFRANGWQVADLATGVLVGTAVISRCEEPTADDPVPLFKWHLINVKRLVTPTKPKRKPQPVWFHPF